MTGDEAPRRYAVVLRGGDLSRVFDDLGDAYDFAEILRGEVVRLAPVEWESS